MNKFYSVGHKIGGLANRKQNIGGKMNMSVSGRFVFRATMAAVFFIVPKTHALAWCPTLSDYQITCNQCSRELTCDVNGFGLVISGNGVTLNGNSHWISYAPGRALRVLGYANSVRYLNIEYPGTNGIELSGATSNGLNTILDHVYVTNAGSNGIYNTSAPPVSINNSSVYYAGDIGVGALGARNTDIWRSTINHGAGTGYIATNPGSNNSYIIGNYFAYNKFVGVLLGSGSGPNVSGFVLSTNTIYGNGDGGLRMLNFSGTVQRNYGRDNGFNWWSFYPFDCTEYHSSPVSISHYGNDWGTSSGGGCNP